MTVNVDAVLDRCPLCQCVLVIVNGRAVGNVVLEFPAGGGSTRLTPHKPDCPELGKR